MFIITDCTREVSQVTVSNDVKDVADIILGITGDEDVVNYALKNVGDMHFGDIWICNPIIVECRKGE